MEKGKLKRQTLLTYDNIYSKPIDLLSNLRALPQSAAIEFIAYLLHLFNVRKRSDQTFQSGHFIQWMLKMEGDSQQVLYEFISHNQALVFDPGFILLDRRPCLDLIQYLLVHSDPGKNQALSKNDFGVLFRLLLMFNEKEASGQQFLFNWDGTGTYQQFADGVLKVQLANIENERFKDYTIPFLKVYYFFKFCETSPEYTGYLDLFLKKNSLKSYKDYLWMLLSPYLKLMTNEGPTPKMHINGDEEFLSFYYRLIINAKAQIDSDYRSLRNFPLYQSDEKTFLFLDFRFFVDKLYNGFLFDFSAITGLGFSKLKASMGNDFSERILFYTIMDNCFGEYSDVRFTGEELKIKLQHSEPDYYIRQHEEIFLFEFKDILLSAEVKYAHKIEDVKRGLLDKLEKDAKGNKKGISQLINSIKEILGGKYTDKEIDRPITADTIIFPIIVHTDISLEAYGVNYFLNQRLQQLMATDGVIGRGIQNLTLIHLDNLLLLQDYFKSRKLELGDCLKSYHLYTSSGDPVNDMISFDEFVKYYFVEKNNEPVGKPAIFNEILMGF